MDIRNLISITDLSVEELDKMIEVANHIIESPKKLTPFHGTPNPWPMPVATPPILGDGRICQSYNPSGSAKKTTDRKSVV